MVSFRLCHSNVSCIAVESCSMSSGSVSEFIMMPARVMSSATQSTAAPMIHEPRYAHSSIC